MEKFGRSFLYVFLADGILSLIDEASGHQILPLRILVALTVLGWAVALYIGMMLSPRLSKRVLFAPVLFALWAELLAALPLSLFYPQECGMILSVAQTVLGLAVLVAFGRRGESGWTVPVLIERRENFSWGNLAYGAFLSAVLAAGAGLLLVISVTTVMEQKTAGFVRVRPSGIYFDERRFQRGDKEVCLVGMVHVAEKNFYDELAGDLRNKDSAIVLLEGITDRENHLEGKFGYQHLAGLLGFSAQENSAFSQVVRDALTETPTPDQDSRHSVEYRRADIDVSDFRPETIALIKAVGDLLHSRTLDEFLQKFNDPNSPLHDESSIHIISDDVIGSRNTHLIEELKEALESHKAVIVPWGAGHMPAIQSQLEEWGFRETGRISRRAVTFAK